MIHIVFKYTFAIDGKLFITSDPIRMSTLHELFV
jgi:hypothetical protein